MHRQVWAWAWSGQKPTSMFLKVRTRDHLHQSPACLWCAYWDMGDTLRNGTWEPLVELNKASVLHCTESWMLLDLETFPSESKFLSTVSLIKFLNFGQGQFPFWETHKCLCFICLLHFLSPPPLPRILYLGLQLEKQLGLIHVLPNLSFLDLCQNVKFFFFFFSYVLLRPPFPKAWSWKALA